NRGARFEEQIEVLRLLWREPSVTFRGRWHTIIEAGINPLPLRREIPIWIGGAAEPAIRRAARLADGFFPQVPKGERAAWVERLHGWLEEAGRAPETFGLEPLANARGSDQE